MNYCFPYFVIGEAILGQVDNSHISSSYQLDTWKPLIAYKMFLVVIVGKVSVTYTQDIVYSFFSIFLIMVIHFGYCD